MKPQIIIRQLMPGAWAAAIQTPHGPKSTTTRTHTEALTWATHHATDTPPRSGTCKTCHILHTLTQTHPEEAALIHATITNPGTAARVARQYITEIATHHGYSWDISDQSIRRHRKNCQ